MSESIPFRIHQVYQQEVARLLSSRKRSRLIHTSGDIDASGDEVEVPFRDFLRRRLPSKYFVGHGHIVDKSLNVSPQFDVIVADNNATPILFEAENGSQYFPWESVYAVGELKASYLKAKRPIKKFADNIRKLKQQLVRDATPNNYLGDGISFGDGFSLDDNRSLRNPLFQFVVFFDSGDGKREDIADEYCGTADENLPVISIFLDGKSVVKAEHIRIPEGVGMGLIELDPLGAIERNDIDWMQVNYLSRELGGAQALVALILGLFEHLNRCVLMIPRLSDYLDTIMHTAANQPLPLTPGGVQKIAMLSDQPLSEEVVKLMEYRAARGKSPFRKIAKSEIDSFLKESGIRAEDLMRSWHLPGSDTDDGKL